MAKYYEPYNSEYCKAAGCSKRHGNKCTVIKCIRNLKRIIYWVTHGVLLPEDVEE